MRIEETTKSREISKICLIPPLNQAIKLLHANLDKRIDPPIEHNTNITIAPRERNVTSLGDFSHNLNMKNE